MTPYVKRCQVDFYSFLSWHMYDSPSIPLENASSDPFFHAGPFHEAVGGDGQSISETTARLGCLFGLPSLPAGGVFSHLDDSATRVCEDKHTRHTYPLCVQDWLFACFRLSLLYYLSPFSMYFFALLLLHWTVLRPRRIENKCPLVSRLFMYTLLVIRRQNYMRFRRVSKPFLRSCTAQTYIQYHT